LNIAEVENFVRNEITKNNAFKEGSNSQQWIEKELFPEWKVAGPMLWSTDRSDGIPYREKL